MILLLYARKIYLRLNMNRGIESVVFFSVAKTDGDANMCFSDNEKI